MIQIEISNFKGILDSKVYTFEEGTMNHLVGPSGAGKSTILTAFEWGLFGKISSVKPRSRKDLIPRVNLQISGVTIDRNGSDLEVITQQGTKLVSDAAQGYIYTIFGDKDLWKSCSYLEQRSRNILLEGSGEDKLKILRELVYGYGIGQENDPEFYLTRLQEKIKQVQDQRKRSRAVYDSYYDDVETQVSDFYNSHNRWEESEYSIEELRKIIDQKNRELKELSRKHSEQKCLRENLESLRDRLKILKQDPPQDISDTYERDREDLLNRIEKLKDLEANSKLEIKVSKLLPFQINSDRLTELQKVRIQYDSLKSDLKRFRITSTDPKVIREFIKKIQWFEELQKLRKLQDYIKDVETYNSGLQKSEETLSEKIEKIQLRIGLEVNSEELICRKASLENSLRTFKSQKPLKCPKCTGAVYMTGKGDLAPFEDIDISKTKSELKQVESILEDFDTLQKLQKRLKDIQKELQKSQQESIPEINLDRLQDLSQKDLTDISGYELKNKDFLINILEKLEDLPECPSDQDLKELTNGQELSSLLGSRLSEYLQDPQKFFAKPTVQDTMEFLNSGLKLLEDTRKKWDKYNSELEIIESQIGKSKTKIIQDFNEFGLERLEHDLNDLRKLEIDWVKFQDIESKLKRLEELESKVVNTEMDLKVLETLYEKIKKLSIEPMERIIEVINNRLNEHLDTLFTETPIRVILSLFRQSTGSKRDSFLKIVVNLQVYHGENNYPNINHLSGGEADRVSLALTLTLAEIFGSPILLLDECMASLDSELREACLGIIKGLSGNKITVIDVCHETVDGYYCNVKSVI